jgi:hypothetical protein
MNPMPPLLSICAIYIGYRTSEARQGAGTGLERLAICGPSSRWRISDGATAYTLAPGRA